MAFSPFGLDRISAEQRAKVLEYRDTDNSAQGGTATGVSYLTGSAGGYFVPASFQHEIDQKMKYFCPVLDGKICRVIQTDSGAVLPFPTGDDTGNVGVLVSENTPVSEVPVVVGSKNLGAGGGLSASWHLGHPGTFADCAFDLDGAARRQVPLGPWSRRGAIRHDPAPALPDPAGWFRRLSLAAWRWLTALAAMPTLAQKSQAFSARSAAPTAD